MNEQNEIGGDLRNEYEAIQADEADTCSDCGDIVGHLTHYSDGEQRCDECDDHFQSYDEYCMEDQWLDSSYEME